MLPSYEGEYEARSEVRKIPSQKFPSPPKMDIVNLRALMSAPIKCTLPLANVLRVKPELWKELGKYLKQIGIDVLVSNNKSSLKGETVKQNYEPIPLNKVGDYCKEEDGNMTVPVEFQGKQMLTILDSGPGVGIATKNIRESWGKPALRKTRMKLQLDDGYIGKPLAYWRKW